MKDFGNIFWVICGGFIVAGVWAILGLLFCATVVGIPLGKDLFKCAKFSLAPFGKAPQSNASKNLVVDILWICTFAIPLLLFFIAMGLIYTITLVGIPFGKQCFKMVVLAMGPFNVDFEDIEDDSLPPREVY